MTSPSELFIDKEVLLVHFSGFAKGCGDSATDALDPLERLDRVISLTPEISCSTVKRTDSFQNGNWFGTAGVIIKVTSFNDITHSSSTDGGTLPPIPPSVVRQNTNGKNSIRDLIDAIDQRPPNQHNEICVRNYTVVGMFCDGTVQFQEYKVSLDAFRKRYRSLNMYILESSGLKRVGNAMNQVNFSDPYVTS